MDYVLHNELRIYFFLQFVSGGNLFDNLYDNRRFSEESAKFISA